MVGAEAVSKECGVNDCSRSVGRKLLNFFGHIFVRFESVVIHILDHFFSEPFVLIIQDSCMHKFCVCKGFQSEAILQTSLEAASRFHGVVIAHESLFFSNG